MKVLLQRVLSSSVMIENELVAKIGPGLLLLLGIGHQDSSENLLKMAKKIAHLRIFSDNKGRFHHSLLETEGSALVVPQFTLFADTSKGRRPEFFGAMPPVNAKPLTQQFAKLLNEQGIKKVEQGVFGANMQLSLVNDGPVSLMLEN